MISKRVQLISCTLLLIYLLCVYFSESLDLLKVCILHIVALFCIFVSCVLARIRAGLCTTLCTTLCTALCIHFGTCGLESGVQFGHGTINGC